MKTVESVKAMRDVAAQARRGGQRIGLVPTMGCLHEGHLSLVRMAKRSADFVVVSVFVNPTQFGPAEDYEAYPRDLPRDRALCEAEGVDALFCPSVPDMYASNHSVYVQEENLSAGLCGKMRLSHFRGVATVVCKLLNIVQPDVAVFGRKDAQQARLIERMARDLNIPVAIAVGPTVREPDGLAMSSRNRYLSVGERAQAVAVPRALTVARDLFTAGTHRADALKASIAAVLASAPDVAVEYIALVDEENLQPIEKVTVRAMAAVAVRIGRTRLIDNVLLDPASPGSDG